MIGACLAVLPASSQAPVPDTTLHPSLVLSSQSSEILPEFEGRGGVLTVFTLSFMFPAGRNAQTPEADFTTWITTLGPPPGSGPQPSMCAAMSSGSHSGISSRAPCSTSAKDSSTRWEGRNCSFAWSPLTCWVSKENVSALTLRFYSTQWNSSNSCVSNLVTRCSASVSKDSMCLKLKSPSFFQHGISLLALPSKSIYPALEPGQLWLLLYLTFQIKATTKILLFPLLLCFFRSLLSDRYSRMKGPLKFIYQ